MELFTPVFNFITDKSNNRGRKIVLILLSIFILFLTDNIFGFSYYYNLNNKINISNQIHAIVSDTKTDPSIRQQLSKLNNDVLHHRSVKDFLYESVVNYDKSSDPFHFFIFYLTSSISIVFIMIGFVVVVYKQLNKANAQFLFTPPLFTVKVLFITEFGLLLISLLMTWACSLIPIIAGRVMYNYFINIGINGFLMWGLVIVSKKKPETTTSNKAEAQATNEL